MVLCPFRTSLQPQLTFLAQLLGNYIPSFCTKTRLFEWGFISACFRKDFPFEGFIFLFPLQVLEGIWELESPAVMTGGNSRVAHP